MLPTLPNKLHWRLPTAYVNDKTLSRISWDGQIYTTCPQCSWELRIDPAFASVADDLQAITCRKCSARGLQLIRHLMYIAYRCEDCENVFEVQATAFDDTRCPYCLSQRLSILFAEITPPFPPRFGEMIVAKDHPWGDSAYEDGDFINQDLQSMNFMSDFPLYMLAAAVFCQRLRLYGGYAADEAAVALMLNLEGNLLRDCFRRTGEIPYGLKALDLFEESVQKTEEPTQRALVEHNVAMVIYSLLSRYPEELATLLAKRSNLRMEGVEAAERALLVFEKGMYRADPSFLMQSARIHHIIGDLLRVGQATNAQLERAVEHLNIALNAGILPTEMALWVRESRAMAISEMSDPPAEWRDQAIEELELVIARDESNRAWSEKWISLANLAELYLGKGNNKRAITLLERAIAQALDEIDRATDESIIEQKGKIYVGLFDKMARVYALTKQAEKALDILETLRTSTLRLYTMSEAERQERLQAAAEASVTNYFKALFSGKPRHTQVQRPLLKSSLKHIRSLLDYLGDTPTALVTFSIHSGTVTAITVIAGVRKVEAVESIQWSLTYESIRFLEVVTNLDGSPLRSARLEQMCRKAYKALFAPLENFLGETGVTRLVISAPGLLSHLPFEAFGNLRTETDCLGERFELLYLPSLSLGVDLLSTGRQQGEGRMLVIGYAGDDLPYTQKEISNLKELWGSRLTLIDGKNANKKTLLYELQGDYDYIHFCCHGTFDPLNPLNSALLFTPDSQRDSDRITAHDILQLNFLHSPVVSMSACSSALTSYDLVNNCVGLTGCFLRAGARCIIGSRWPIYDDTAALFMKKLFTHLRDTTRSPHNCLSKVQAEMRQRFMIDDWAAFSYLGLP